MKATPQTVKLGPLEQDVLSIVWQHPVEGTPVSAVLTALNQRPKQSHLAYTTIMTILNRLVDKGYLKRVKTGRAFLYQAADQRQSFLQELIRKTLTSFGDTFGEEAIAAFAQEATKLTKEQKAKLKHSLATKTKKNS